MGRDSPREFYYVEPPTLLQRRAGLEIIHTRGPLINMQCNYMDKKKKKNERCKRKTVVEFVGNLGTF